MHTLEEVGREIDAVRGEIELICVRGLASSTPGERRRLADLAASWDRLGAAHVSARLQGALGAIDRGAKEAAGALLSSYSSLHVFERLLSMEAAVAAWEAYREALEEDAPEQTPERPAAAAPPARQPPAIEDRNGALAVLDELARAVEDLVRTGLTSATKSTRDKLDASFREASRRKLLRLGAALRYVNEEIGRFLADDGSFVARRFAFFLHRSWLLARGVAKGIRASEDRLLAALLSGGAAPKVVSSVEVVTLGVIKRTLANASTFDFKLRVVNATDPSLVGRALTYSLVFPRKKEAKDLPSEAYLHLPQPQKFLPKILLEAKRIKVTEAAVAIDDQGSGRLMLGPKSSMVEAGEHAAWLDLYRFDVAEVLARARTATPGPLDLAVELQEEVFIAGATLSAEPRVASEGKRLYSLEGEQGLRFDAVIPDGPDGDDLLGKLRAGLGPKKRKLLYGVVYYEFGRLMLLPLSVVPSEPTQAEEPAVPDDKTSKKKGAKAAKPAKKKGDEPELVTISDKKFDVSALVGALGL